MRTIYSSKKSILFLITHCHHYHKRLCSSYLVNKNDNALFSSLTKPAPLQLPSQCSYQQWKHSKDKIGFPRRLFGSVASRQLSVSQQRNLCSNLISKSKCVVNNHNHSKVSVSSNGLKSFSCHSQQCRAQSTRSQDTIMNVFDRKAKRLQKDRAALSYIAEDVSVYDYLKDEFGYRLSDRICDIKRVFKTAVDLGCGRGHLSKNIYNDMVESLYQCELSAEMLMRAEPSPEVPTHKLIIDEEFLPFKDNSLDLVLSNLSLHWVNDLPRCLSQILQALKNDSALIGSMFGGDTLYEMRVSLQLAEQEREGGFAPHISPYTTVNDLGNLLTRAGFTMLTIDMDEVVINYPSMIELMYDLKGMAENNCSWTRKPQLHRDSLIAAASIYKEMYGSDEGIPATFQVINFIGWKPDRSQPRAAKRGSASVSIKDIGNLDKLTKQMEHAHKNGDVKAKEKLEGHLHHFAKKLENPEDNGGKK